MHPKIGISSVCTIIISLITAISGSVWMIRNYIDNGIKDVRDNCYSHMSRHSLDQHNDNENHLTRIEYDKDLRNLMYRLEKIETKLDKMIESRR